MTTSSSSLKTVLKTTVTRSFLASTYLREQRRGGGVRPGRKGAGGPCGCALHGLVVSVVDHGPLLALLALFLELEVLLEDGGEAVPLQHPGLVDSLVLIGREHLQVVEEGYVITCREKRSVTPSSR